MCRPTLRCMAETWTMPSISAAPFVVSASLTTSRGYTEVWLTVLRNISMYAIITQF